MGVEVTRQKEFGREHGCSKLHTEADGQSAKSFPRDEPFYGLHVENRIGKDDQYVAGGIRPHHGHQTSRT